MSTPSTILLILMVLLLGLAGYYYLDRIAPLQTTVDELQQENQEMAFQIELLEQKNGDLTRQLEEKLQEFSTEKEAEIGRLKSTYDELIVGLNEEIEKGEITITRLADQLSVNIVDRIIFPSGSAQVNEAGIKVLQRVGRILKETEDKRIKVEGHTDNIPIHKNLQAEFPSNWELSAARATNVVRVLEEQVGIDARRLEVAGYGQHRPIASNKTRRGRAKNRRIEILLLPRVQDSSMLSDKK